MILILSSDPVAAALLGALVETLGHAVHFARPPEDAADSMRRVRPRVCLIDCEDGTLCNAQTLGRATMRRISVVIFGTAPALSRVHTLALDHRTETLLVPADAALVDETIKRALQKIG